MNMDAEKVAQILFVDGRHMYLSTSCLHDLHVECRINSKRYDGSFKAAGTCKHCHAPCICPCHLEAECSKP
jgi:hypothetical protein